jgi:O-antigen ligase
VKKTPSLSGVCRIEQFRSERPSLPIHPAEKWLLVILGVHLCFLPWALGTMHLWSQLVSLGLGLCGFIVALLPRASEDELGRPTSLRMAMWPWLMRFPIFWLGLALLLYVLGQALNPSWRYEQDATFWWLVRIKNVAWLPTSIDAPFAKSNAWCQLIVYSAAWLVVCSAWVGLTRRRSWRVLLSVLTANALLLGGLLAFQRLSNTSQLPWPLIELIPRAGLTSSFVYHNHAGAYLGLVAFCAVVLAVWGYDHSVRKMEKSSPAPVLALAAIFIAGSIPFTLSRAASFIFSGMILIFAVWWSLRYRRRRSHVTGVDFRAKLALVVFVGLFVLYIGWNLDFSSINSRFDVLLKDPSNEIKSRLEARDAGMTMLADNGWRGVGAGCFRHLFPVYVRRYPDIYEGGHLFWEHLHNDWLEVSIELGAAGILFVLGMAGYWLRLFLRRRAFWHFSIVPMLFGCAGTLIHASIDFPFQCPAILTTWCLLLAMVARCLEIDATRCVSDA